MLKCVNMHSIRVWIGMIGFASALAVFAGCGPRKPTTAELRRQKAEQDSLALFAQQKSLAYYRAARDSLLPLAQGILEKNFVYEKDERYEDHGHYVHRLLRTASNSSRCYIQTYATDDYHLQVKVYRVGSKPIYPQTLLLSAGDVHTRQKGAGHSFEAEGWHEMLTLSDTAALEALHFLDGFRQERVLACIEGTQGNYKFYLSDRDKQALMETYALGQMMHDIHQLELQIYQTNIEIDKYEHRIHHRS